MWHVRKGFKNYTQYFVITYIGKAYIYIYMCVCVCVCVCIYMCVCVCVYIYICVCVYIYICIYIYIFIRPGHMVKVLNVEDKGRCVKEMKRNT